MRTVRTSDRVLSNVLRGRSPSRSTRLHTSPPPLQVVILAAGMGTRLGRDHPKPLTPLDDGRTILQRQLDGLRAVLGADVPITAVVGYRCEMIMQAAPDLTFVYNPDFATTNTSKSLLRALSNSRDGGVLWLNGDVVFDPELLAHILPLTQGDDSLVCVNTSAVGAEEVKYTTNPDGTIRELSKTVEGGLGEAIGINFVSARHRDVLIRHLEACDDQDYFERGLETAIAAGEIVVRPVDVSRFAAVEVDTEADLEAANTTLQ